MNIHEKVNYLELPSNDFGATKRFFESVFQWSFTDYGPEYTAFTNAGIEGGFFKSNLKSSTENGAALVVFYSERLEESQTKIESAGGKILRPIFAFPGGRRFQFADPTGNEFAVWSDKGLEELA